MAAKKKAAPKKKKAPAPRRPARKSAKSAALAPQSSVSVEPEAKVSGLGKFIVVLALLLLVLVLFMALRKPSVPPAEAPAPAVAAPAAAAPAPAKPAEAVPAASTEPKISTGKPGEEGTGITLKTGASMTLRCWRKKGAQASLDVFGPHNKAVAHLSSDPGDAGWTHLTWKAQDDAGQDLAPGVYYLRPSTSGADKTVEVTLEP
ncbi:MAG TPA: hypothetical protein VK842_03750 [bacterium]|jgi:hypothetical protein|nr:hypothetical protein [bacterium]